MSTPLNQLPSTSSHSGNPPDPEVINIIQDMVDQEIAAASATGPSSSAATPAPMQVQTSQPVVSVPIHCPMKPSGMYWNSLHAQHAMLAAIIALVLFYPPTLQVAYAKFPKLSGIFESYDMLIRAALFAGFIYFLLMRLDL